MDVWSDTPRQDQERTHPRNNESDSCLQKDHGETLAIELVRACDESCTEESIESGYTREKEERTTENKMGRLVPTRLEK